MNENAKLFPVIPRRYVYSFVELTETKLYKLVSQLIPLRPIGDALTMGSDDAIIAAEWLKAQTVIPIHHSTFPVIAQDAGHFVNQLKERGIKGVSLLPGEQLQV